MAGTPPRPLRCDQTGEIFRSASDACKEMGFSRSLLSIHMKDPNKKPHVKGYTFTDLTYGTPPFVKKPMYSPLGPRRKIRCNNTGKLFNSISEAAVELCLDASSISKHLRGNTEYSTVGGYTFTAMD